jgi:hypothetical protein
MLPQFTQTVPTPAAFIRHSLKNKFRKRQKPEVAPDYEPGVLKVCDELIRQGLATKWRWAGSMLVVKKLGDLPRDFSEIARKAQQA